MIIMIMERIYASFTWNDLERLKELALREHDGFFERNPHLKFIFLTRTRATHES